MVRDFVKIYALRCTNAGSTTGAIQGEGVFGNSVTRCDGRFSHVRRTWITQIEVYSNQLAHDLLSMLRGSPISWSYTALTGKRELTR
jgi:hypothetical protein